MEVDFKKMGLVLEGGGMRGVFTCGVLDYMMDHHIEFPYVIGVSAGACNGLSFMSHQRGRAKYSNIDMLEKYHYIGLKYFWNQHSILDQHLHIVDPVCCFDVIEIAQCIHSIAALKNINTLFCRNPLKKNGSGV